MIVTSDNEFPLYLIYIQSSEDYFYELMMHDHTYRQWSQYGWTNEIKVDSPVNIKEMINSIQEIRDGKEVSNE